MNVRPDHGPVDRGHNQHSEWTPFKPLLMDHAFVAGQESVEAFPFDQRQQLPVFDTAPIHADYGMNLMPRQESRQLAGHIFIEQNLQSCA
jgi:hypothetical protein